MPHLNKISITVQAISFSQCYWSNSSAVIPYKICSNAQVITPELCLQLSAGWGIFNTESVLDTVFSPNDKLIYCHYTDTQR